MKTYTCARCRHSYALLDGRPAHVGPSGPWAGRVDYEQQATHDPVLSLDDRLDVMRDACAQLRLRPCYAGESETAIVLVRFEGGALKIAATDAPARVWDEPLAIAPERVERAQPSPMFRALNADLLGGRR